MGGEKVRDVRHWLVGAQAGGEQVSGVAVDVRAAATVLDDRRSTWSLFWMLTLGDGAVAEIEWL